MSGSETDIQWFIAREGKQHGPISDAELKKIVELAHLKPTDLVWRQGFTDWRTAVSVFPDLGSQPQAAKPAPAAPPPEPAPLAAAPSQSFSAAPAPQASTRAPVASPEPSLSINDPQPQFGMRTAGGPAIHGQAHRDNRQPQADGPRGAPLRAEPVTGRPGQGPGPGLGQHPAATGAFVPPHAASGPGPAPGGMMPGPRMTTDSRRPADFSAPMRDEAPAPSRGRKLALVAVGLISMMGVGGWLSSQYKDDVFSYLQPDDGAQSETHTAATTANVMQAPSAPTTTGAVDPAPPAAGNSPEDVDRAMQNRTMWVTVKQEFPDWYQTRVAEVARLKGEHKDQTEINRYLATEIVSLRRENAKYALAASTTRHKELAAAFLANLNHLSKESGDGCYDFISKGESSATIIERLDDPAKTSELEAQVVAIVGAIVEGRKQPAEHAAPLRTDYDVLAGELGRLGWTQADMQLFANPKALAQAPRSRVCSMLKDWFTAHLAIQDPATQERLLYETLKPVISG